MGRHRRAMDVTKVRLPPELVTRLDDLGAERDRSRSYLIRKAVEEYLERNQTGDDLAAAVTP